MDRDIVSSWATVVMVSLVFVGGLAVLGPWSGVVRGEAIDVDSPGLRYLYRFDDADGGVFDHVEDDTPSGWVDLDCISSPPEIEWDSSVSVGIDLRDSSDYCESEDGDPNLVSDRGTWVAWVYVDSCIWDGTDDFLMNHAVDGDNTKEMIWFSLVSDCEYSLRVKPSDLALHTYVTGIPAIRNTWQHVAVTWNSTGSVSLSIDGIPRYSSSWVGPGFDDEASDRFVYLGIGYSHAASQSSDVMLDEVAYWNRVLTISEIVNASFEPSILPPVEETRLSFNLAGIELNRASLFSVFFIIALAGAMGRRVLG